MQDWIISRTLIPQATLNKQKGTSNPKRNSNTRSQGVRNTRSHPTAIRLSHGRSLRKTKAYTLRQIDSNKKPTCTYVFYNHPYSSRNVLYMRQATADDGTTLTALISLVI